MKRIILISLIFTGSLQAKMGQVIFKGYTQAADGSYEFQINHPTALKRSLRLKLGDRFLDMVLKDFKQITLTPRSSSTALTEAKDLSELFFINEKNGRTLTLVFNQPVAVEEPDLSPAPSPTPEPETRNKIETAIHDQYLEKIKPFMKKSAPVPPAGEKDPTDDLDALFLRPLSDFRVSVLQENKILGLFGQSTNSPARHIEYGSVQSLIEEGYYYQITPAIGAFPNILMNPQTFEIICVYGQPER